MAARSDAALVTAARGGDRDAFAALVERHRPALLRACRGSADAAQEAVLQALRGLGGLRDEHAFGAWLCGIGRNLARREPQPPPPPIAPEPSTTPEGSDPFVRERVLGAVAALPPGQREAVALFYLADLSHAQIAARLGISVGAVKTRLHKARAALQTRLIDLRREPTVTMSTPVPMRVAEIRETEGDTHIVLLEEVDGVRRVPIWIARAEAEALSMRLNAVERPRPGTYRFTADLLAAAGAELQEVRIVRLAETIFYAEAALAGGVRVDARPSDALSLALETGAPVVAGDAVVAAAAMSEAQIADEIAQSLARR